jgi:predicted 2-oxoglutarate/Fe(II)-dependent dioxygenase YbiX
LPLPGIEIEGVGLLSLPLSSAQVRSIKTVATQAPFGKGRDTVVDTAVRDTLQIDAARVTMTNPEWHTALSKLVGQVAGRLGVSPENARAELYKILLYEKGGHFKTHQDTEKESGMFGTLIVQFPSQYNGGTIAVRHAGVEREFDMGASDSSSRHGFHHVAFYADCAHEIREVTDGCRLVAVYSLCWNQTAAPPPSPPSLETALLLKEPLKKAERCLGWILEHEYTPASLSKYGILALKGADRAVADSLVTAGELMRLDDPSLSLSVHLAQARRDDQDVAGDEEAQGAPELAMDGDSDGLFCADGTEPSEADRQVVDIYINIYIYI